MTQDGEEQVAHGRALTKVCITAGSPERVIRDTFDVRLLVNLGVAKVLRHRRGSLKERKGASITKFASLLGNLKGDPTYL